MSQRVTATVERKAARLVRVETEHETLLTTPEHPFATAPSGWVPAGRLVPGDRVVSAPSRMLRVHSVRLEERIHPVSVFNLTVAKSHAYWVGLDRLLVHNTSCSSNEPSHDREAPDDDPLTPMLRERDEINRTLEALRRTTPRSDEIEARLTELLHERQRLQTRITRLRQARPELRPSGASRPEPAATQRELEAAQQGFEAAQRELEAAQQELAEFQARAPGSAEEAGPATKEDDPALPPLLRENDEINRALRTLSSTMPGFELRRAQLLRARNRIQVRISRLRRARANPIGDGSRSRRDGSRQALEAAQRELAEFDARTPSKAEVAEFSKKRTALQKRIAGAQFVYDRAKQILEWQSELAALETRSGATEAEQRALEQTRQALRQKLRAERSRATRVTTMRKRRADPTLAAAERADQQRRRRSAAHEADASRPRGALEQLEEQLAELRQLPESEASRDRIEHLRARTEAMRGQIALSRKVEVARKRLNDARRRFDSLSLRRRNTIEITKKIAKLEQEFAAARIERMQLRLKERLLAELDNEGLDSLPHEIDETRVRELERELERELATGALDEQHLAGLERELGHSEPTDPTLEQLRSEFEANVDELEANIHYEAQDVDARVHELQQLLQAPPSPDRNAGAEPRFQALQRELREERNALEAVHFELVNQTAHIQTTQASSSSGATWQQRLIAIQAEQAQIREQWRARMQARLDQARHQLDTLQRDQRRHDEVAEAELTRVIALLAHELESPVL